MAKNYITILELANITGYSYGKAGNIIRALNGELKEKGFITFSYSLIANAVLATSLKEKGFITFRGKISKEYLQERLNIIID